MASCTKMVSIVFLFTLLFPFVYGDLGERKVLCIAEDSLEIQKVAHYFLHDGVNKNHIKTLLAQEASNHNINKALKEMKEGMTPKDTLFFCYSGQVIVSPSQDIYLLTSRKKQEAFPLRKEIFATAGNSVFILELENERNTDLKQALSAMLKKIDTSQQITILAVDYYQNSQKRYNFWQFILQGLSYKANRFPHDSHISIAEFFGYLKLAIPRVTNQRQTPYFIFSPKWVQNSNEIKIGSVHYNINQFFTKTAPFLSTKDSTQIALKTDKEQTLRKVSKSQSSSLSVSQSMSKSQSSVPKKSSLAISQSSSLQTSRSKITLPVSQSSSSKSSISFSQSNSSISKSQSSFSISKTKSSLQSLPSKTSISKKPSSSFSKTFSKSKSSKPKQEFSTGNYYALIIANYRYKSSSGIWHSLETPKKTALALKKLLESQYNFKKITYLKNGSKRKIYRALSQLYQKGQKNDNILICYFGHGYYDVDSDRGYWVPVEAKGINTKDFISSSSIRKWLVRINERVRHTFLLCESSFTPEIIVSKKNTNGKIGKRENEKKSCQILAFGDFEYIDEEYRNSPYSPFGYYLIRALKNNKKAYYSNVLLAKYLKKSMKKALVQKPLFGNVLFSQNKGGLFFFRLD